MATKESGLPPRPASVQLWTIPPPRTPCTLGRARLAGVFVTAKQRYSVDSGGLPAAPQLRSPRTAIAEVYMSPPATAYDFRSDAAGLKQLQLPEVGMGPGV